MATTTHDDGFHEIQLNGKQLVFLFMAGTVVAVVIFLLGVFVGRGVRAEVPGADPLMAQGTQTPGSDAAPEPPPAVASTGGGAPATAKDDYQYSDILDNRARKEAPAERPATPTPPPAVPTAPAAVAASRIPAPSSSPAPATTAAEPAGDGFAIQVAALAKRDEAETIVRRLNTKGYAAYVIAPAAGKPQMYRVRVGKFKERREAESVSARLQKEEQFKPWIVR